jgi:hypothetical protein
MMPLRHGDVYDEDDDTAVINNPTFSQQPKQQPELLWLLSALRSLLCALFGTMFDHSDNTTLRSRK